MSALVFEIALPVGAFVVLALIVRQLDRYCRRAGVLALLMRVLGEERAISWGRRRGWIERVEREGDATHVHLAR